jgi:hypothetical protein
MIAMMLFALRHRRPIAPLLGVLTVAVLGLVVPSTSSAGTARHVTVKPSSGPAGTTVEIKGEGYPVGFSVTLFLDQATTGPELARNVPVAAGGGFTARATIPGASSAGTHPIFSCLRRSASTVPICDASPAGRFTVTTPTTTSSSTPPTAPPVVNPNPSSTVTTSTLSISGPSTTLGGDPAPSTTLGLFGATTTTTLPLAVPDQDFPDLYIQAMEINQGVQNLDNSMPLVAGRRTWIRVYPRVDHGPAWGPVDGAMLLTNGADDLILYPENGPIGAIAGLPDRTDADAALNFLVPDAFAVGGTQFKALIWSFSPSTLTEKEPNPSNNLKTLAPAFHTASGTQLILAPLDDGTGPAPAPTIASTTAAANAIAADLRKYLPMAEPAILPLFSPVGPGPEASTPGRWTFTTGALRDEPLIRMSVLHALWGLPGELRLLGSLDSSISAGGFAGWSKSGYFSAWAKPSDGTPAHEIGHQGGLGHVGCKDTNPADGIPDELAGGGLDETYPTALPECSLAPVDPEGFFGLTNYDDPFVVYSNDPMHPQAAYPFMSYMGTRWIDPYHYCKLLTKYGVYCSPSEIGVPGKFIPISDPVDCTPEEDGPFTLELCLGADLPSYPPSATRNPLVLTGDPQQTVLRYPTGDVDSYRYTTVAYDADAQTGVVGDSMPLPATDALDQQFQELVDQVKTGLRSTRLVIRLVDADGKDLVVVPVDRDESTGHGNGETRDATGTVVQPIPVVDGAVAVELVDGDRVLDRRDASPNAPHVAVEPVEADGRTIHVSWSASDDDGDPLLATVLWSADGETFRPVVIDSAATEATIDDPTLPGGDVTIRVLVGDGWNTAAAEASPIGIPPATPSVLITGATDGQPFARYAPVDLVAQAFDPEDGALDDESVTWSSDQAGTLGTGRALSSRELAPGPHLITATVQDADGGQAEATVTIEVVDDGRPAPRVAGAEPEAESILRAGDEQAAASTGGTGGTGGTGPGVWLAITISVIAVLVAGGAALRFRAARHDRA